MPLSVAQLRDAVSSQISSISGYRQMLMIPEYFSRTPNTLAHKAYSVGVDVSNAQPERQRRAVGLVLESVVRVRIAYRIRPHDILTDYNAALDAESVVVGKILSSYATIRDGVSIRFIRSNRSAPDSSEYLISDIEFAAIHTLNFS